jgi:hypothetical protein
MSLIQSVAVSAGDIVLAQDHNDNTTDIALNAGDYVVTAGTQPNYTATVTSEFLLVDGAKVRLNIHATNSGGSVTLNVNATGAEPVVKPDGSAVGNGELVAGAIYEFVYNGTEWQTMGVGGGIGSNLSDPGADRILFWDESQNAAEWLEVGDNLEIDDKTLKIQEGAIIWKHMETITFSNSSSIQTTANFPDASTAKQYIILVDIKMDTSSNYVEFRINGNSSSGDYVTGLISYNGSFSTTFNSRTAHTMLYGGETGIRCSGQVLIAAQEGADNKVSVVQTLAQTHVSSFVGSVGWAGIGSADNYVKNISFLGTENFTGTFSIYQR